MDETIDVTTLRVRVGERVETIRTTHGLERKDLARRLMVGDNQIGKIERGETLLTVPQALRLRREFGVSLDVLYDEHDHPREDLELLTLLFRLTPPLRRLALAIMRLLVAHQEPAPPADASPAPESG